MRSTRAGLVIAILVSAHAASAVSLPEAWIPVQERLVADDVEGAIEELEGLRSAAEAVQAERLTPYARALVAASSSRDHDTAMRLLASAVELDGRLPSARFALAARRWATGAWVAAGVDYLGAWLAMLRHDETRRALARSVAVWVVLGAAAALLSILVVQTVRTIRRLGFDALWLSRSVFDASNAWVFAVVLIVLPLLAGLDPVWVAVYLAVMGWVYLSRAQRTVAIAACVALALVAPALEAWQQLALHASPLSVRVSDMLHERRVDLGTLREIAGLEEDFAGEESYHVVIGELYRLHGEIERAREEFQRAVVAGPATATPLVLLGNLAQEEGDVQRAVQLYSRAIEIEPRSALAYHNLSSAFDANRRFQEGDQARQTAREIAGGRSSTIGLGSRSSRLRYPALGAPEVERMVRDAPEAARVQLADPRPADVTRGLTSPFSVVFWVGAALGAAVLVARWRWFGPARECSKCGKVFRAEDGGDSSAYCQQCVSVFLRRDRVSMDQQTAKGRQVDRWELACAASRRIAATVLPGSYHAVSRDPWRGVAIATGFWIAVVGAAVWAPLFLPGVEPQLRTAPVTIGLAVAAGVLWLVSAVGSWYRR